MVNKDVYTSIKPKNEVLKKYIDYYYFNSSKEVSFIKTFIFYPHYKNALTIYKNSTISFSKNESVVIPEATSSYTKIYTGIHLQSRIGKIKAPFDKIGVVFQALGINSFMDNLLSEVVKNSLNSNFDYFGENFENVLDNVYATDTIKEKRDYLDAFFLSILTPVEDSKMTKAVALLFRRNIAIQAIADDLDISRKTLLRLFKKHLNCTPKDFASIIKFRKALSLYQASQKELKLTVLAYENNYYDQSDFIKHFKKITGFNPKKFFASISHLGKEDTFWTLID